MKPTLPVKLNFMQKANTGCEIQGKWPINRLKRLSEALLSEEGDIQVELTFGRAGRIPYIKGHISTELELKCERCMQSMRYPIDSHFNLGLVLTEEQIEKLPDEFEPYLVEDDNNHLADMLEDELLLALPLVAMHDSDCSEFLNKQNLEAQSKQKNEVDDSTEKENPFSVLKDLL